MRDEAVIVAVRHERQRASVGRPRRRLAGAAREERRLGRLRAVERRDPDAAILHERDAVAVRRNRWLVAFAQQLRRAAGRRHRPHLHLRLYRAARRIGHQVAFGGPVRSVVAAAHVHDRLAVGGKRQVRQLLPVVFGVAGDAPRVELRTVGHVDVPDAALIERPRDTGAYRRRDQVVGERKAEDLIERKRAAAPALRPRPSRRRLRAGASSCADYNALLVIDLLRTDVRHALRWLRKSPAFTLVAVASLAIGIGFNTALFAVVDAVLFKPLPVAQPDRLVDVFTSGSGGARPSRSAPRRIPTTSTCSAKNDVFEDIVGYSPMFGRAEPRRPLAPRDGRDRHRQLLPACSASAPRSAARSLPDDDRAGRAARGDGVVSLLGARARLGARRRSAARCAFAATPYTIVGVAPPRLHRHGADPRARDVDPGGRVARRRARRACTTSCRRRPARRASSAAAIAGCSCAARLKPGQHDRPGAREPGAADVAARRGEPGDQQGSPHRREGDERRALSSGRRSRCRADRRRS